MNEFNISTTNNTPATLSLSDLGGYQILSGSVNLDLIDQGFEIDEIGDSNELQSAINNSWITAVDEFGNSILNVVSASEYLLRTAYDNNDNGLVDTALFAFTSSVANKALTGDFSGAVSYNGTLSPPIFSVASVNNFYTAGLDDANFLRLSSNNNPSTTITGFRAPTSGSLSFEPFGQVLHVTNVGAKNITLSNNSVNSFPENRFLLNSDKTLQTDESLIAVYDKEDLRWRVVSTNL